MPRVLVAIFLLFTGLLPSVVFALGLGEIELRSALNQPFRAAIPVTSESASDLSGLTVTLAPAATFRQFGLDRAGFLEGFKFNVAPRPGGAVVQVSSTQPVVEPFVTLLLEVQWPQGRLLREYTVLLDPPVFSERSAQPSVTAPVSGPEPEPAQVTRTPEPRQAAPAPSRQAAPVFDEPARGVPGATREVRRNETLWGIAGELQYLDPALNRNQLMMAIYRANPDAFADNINRLKAGVILRIPDAAALARVSRGEANAEVARQNQEWRDTPVRDSARLRLVPPPEGDAAAQTAGGATARSAGDADANTLRQRIRELETQLSDNQRLIEMRDRELAELQQRLAEIQGQPAPQPDVPSQLADEVQPDEPALTDADGRPLPADDAAEAAPDADAPADPEAITDIAPSPAPDQPAQPQPPAVRSDQVVTTQPAADSSFLGGLFSSIWFYIALALAAIAGLFALRRRGAESPASRWESLRPDEEEFAEETHEATTRMSARSPENESFVVEEGAAGGTDELSAAPPPPVSADLTVDADVETPFERTISSDVAVNLDQADPVAEAEFHMAYGLYDQAADLLTKALAAEPDRRDYRLKLLEVLFIWENQPGFLDAAREFHAQIDADSDPDWNKVLIMGKQICPDEELFAAAPAAGADAGAVDLAFGDESTSAVDLNLGEADDSLDIDLGAEPEAVESDPDVLDFDMGDDGKFADDESATDSPTVETPTVETDMSESPTMETPTVESPAVATTMETPTIESPGISESTMETPTVESPAVSATMETPTIESPAVATTMETPTIETPAVDWEDDEKTELAPSIDATLDQPADQTAEIELDDLGLDLSDLDEAGDDYAADDSMIVKADEGLDATGAFDLGGGEIDDGDASGILDVESTSEMRGLDATGDTAEQPAPDDPTSDLLAAGLLDDDADFAALDSGDDAEEITAEMPASDASQVDGPTMTEVGTKLDLARAYIDMGDPDGARSILNEVLEEAGESQRQEAQKLLEDLDG